MRKAFYTLAAMLTLTAPNIMGADYLVQTGASTDATWSESAISATGATLVDLTVAGKTVNEWLTDNGQGKEIWFAAGTYTFTAAATSKQNWKLYGGFSGSETNVNQRNISGGGNWDFENETIFDGGGTIQIINFSSGTAANQTYDGITFQNGYHTSTGSAIMRPGNNSIITNCKFVNNVGNGNTCPGAIQIYNATVTITDCLFKGNTAGQGAGVYINCSNNTVEISGCLFEGNKATYTTSAGGAIQAQNNGGTYKIMSNRFVSNEATSTTGHGAAISINSNNANNIIANNIFTGNKSAADNRQVTYLIAGKIYNNTFYNNESGCIYAPANGATEIINNVIVGKYGNIPGNQQTTVKNNATTTNITTSSEATLSDNIVISTDNTGSDNSVKYACFADPANGDFTLLGASSLIDAGTTLADISTDINGNARPQNGMTDIGAYEMKYYTLTVNLNGTVDTKVSVDNSTIRTDQSNSVNMEVKAVDGERKTVSIERQVWPAGIESISLNGAALELTGLGDTTFTTAPITTNSVLDITMNSSKPTLLSQTAEQPRIVCSESGLTIDNPQGMEISVFATDGRLAGRLNAGTTHARLQLPAGTYIVRTDRTSLKAVVR